MQAKILVHTFAAAFVIGTAIPGIASAQQEEMPIAGGGMSSELSGKVMVVNTETRLMTLKDAEGNYHVLHVPPEVTRLDKIKIGDEVNITEFTSVLIGLVPKEDAGPIAAEMTTEIDRTPGKKPGGTITETLTLFGEIVSLNKSAGKITIKGPNETRTFDVEDRSLLEDVKVGDGVVARFQNEIVGEVK